MFSKTKGLCVWNFLRKKLFVSGKYLLSKNTDGVYTVFIKQPPPQAFKIYTIWSTQTGVL